MEIVEIAQGDKISRALSRPALIDQLDWTSSK